MRLRTLICRYGLDDSVILVPWLSRAETLGYMKHAMFYLTTSLYEGLPIAVLESLALGKAVVSSDVIGNRDCVKDEYNGFLLPMDADLFAKNVVN